MQPKKRRNTFESQIAGATPQDVRELAMFGGKRTPAEKAVWLHLFNGDIIKDASYKEYDPDGSRHILASTQDTLALCKIFLDAVEKRDGKTLRAIARAAENYVRNPAERNALHLQILHIKDMVVQRGGTMTVSLLANLVNAAQTGAILTEPPNAALCAQVRRAAKRLGFPLAKAGRPKKTIQNKT